MRAHLQIRSGRRPKPAASSVEQGWRGRQNRRLGEERRFSRNIKGIETPFTLKCYTSNSPRFSVTSDSLEARMTDYPLQSDERLGAGHGSGSFQPGSYH